VCLIAFDLKFVRVARSYANTDLATGVDSSHPVRPTMRSALHHTIHPSIVKEQVGPCFAVLSTGSGADKKKVMRARKRRSAGDF
jgi:hypothetical protein